MATNCSQSSNTISKPIERVFEDAQHTGKIQLKCRKLRDYPKLAAKYDLVDTISADLSKNRFTEVPMEVCSYLSMEKLNCYHNVIKYIPESIIQLQALTYLNLSRNQLSNIPTFISHLQTLEVLIVSHNRLVSLPEELGVLDKLMELDVSCNQISHLPSQIGNLKSLKSLDVRRNILQELPLDISKLNLKKLDASCNKISQIPTVFRKIETLEEIILDHNPLTLPPAYVCTKGKQHIMKYLQIVAIREDKARLGMLGDVELKKFRKSMPSAPSVSSEDFHSYLDSQDKWKRHTVLSSDPGYSTTDSVDKCRWSPHETGMETQHQIDSNNPATRSTTAQYRSSRYPPPSELGRPEPPELFWQCSSSRLSPDDSSATLTPTTPSVPVQSVVFRPVPLHPAPPTLFPSSPQTPLSPPAPYGPGQGMHGTTPNSPILEDEFTRELQRQKQEYENKKKVAEQLRIQHEEDEREQHCRTAKRMQDEQRALLDRQKKVSEEAKRLEIDKIRADGNCRLVGETFRKSEDSKRAEDAQRLEDINYPRTEQSFYLPDNSPTLNNAWPGPPLGIVSQHAVCSPSAIRGAAQAVPGLVPVVPGPPFNPTSPYRTSNVNDVNSSQPTNNESNLPSYGQTFRQIEDQNLNSHGEISRNVQEQGHGLSYLEHSVNQQRQYNSVPMYHGQNVDVYGQQLGQFPQRASQYERSSVFGGNQYGQQQNHCKYQDSNQVASPIYQQSISESARSDYMGQPNIICSGGPMHYETRPPPTSQRNNHSTTEHLFLHNDSLSRVVAQAPSQHQSHLSTVTSYDPANYGHRGNQFGHHDYQVQGQHDHHSSIPQDFLSENRKANLSSSGSFKEEHRSSENHQQYRRTASDSNQRLPKSDLPISDHQTHGIHITNRPMEEQSILNSNPPVIPFTDFNHNLSNNNNYHLSNSPHNIHTAITTIPTNGDTRPIMPQGLPGAQRPKGAAPDPTKPIKIVDIKAKRPMQSAPPAVIGVLPTSKISTIQQDDQLKRAQHPLKSTSTIDGPKGIGDQRLRSVQNDTVQQRSTGSTSSEDDKKRPPPTHSTGLHNSATVVSKRAGTGMSSNAARVPNTGAPCTSTTRVGVTRSAHVAPNTSTASVQLRNKPCRDSTSSTASISSTKGANKRPSPSKALASAQSANASKSSVDKGKRSGTVMTSAHVKMLDDYSKVASNVNSSVQKHETQIENHKHMEQLRQIISTRLKRSLPDNLLEALCDGVLLCHLANQIRPRSVASVHVPSPAVPKLSLPKCKKNVENFLEACRKIGVPKDQICDATDILTERSLHHVATTVLALVTIATKNHTEVSAV